MACPRACRAGTEAHEAAPATQWVKPGLIGRVKHLRGEEDLRHASLQGFLGGQIAPAWGFAILRNVECLACQYDEKLRKQASLTHLIWPYWDGFSSN